MAEEYDLVVIGGGTGGYVAAIRASQLDMRVAIVEQDKLGGTCLHRGCIPSKSLLKSAAVFQQTINASEFGVETTDVTLNFSDVQKRKDRIVASLYQGVESLMKKGKIDVYEGTGRILGPSIFSPMPGTISVEYNHGEENTMLVPKHVLISTGSAPKPLPGLEFDGELILSSDEALQMNVLPSSVIIVGGGAIGVEWASMLADFGVHVTVIEYMEHILPTEDETITKEAEKRLKAKNIHVITEAKVMPETLKKNKNVTVDVAKNEGVETFTADKMLVSIGRSTNISGIGLQNTDISVSENVIQTNNVYQTEESHIYAIGDVIGGMQLAHVASHEGIIAVEHMADNDPLPLKYDNVPSCIYSSPEIASVGLTEKQAYEQGYKIETGEFSFNAIAKAKIEGNTDGFVKVIADSNSQDLLGVHMIGPQVTDMISEASLAKVLDATPWEITQNIHPHPSLSEIVGEAALAVDDIQIHG